MRKCTAETHPLFIQAAQIIIDRFETPDKFIYFLSQLLHWIHCREVVNKDYSDAKDYHYEAQQMIEEIALPWVRGEKDMIKEMAEGVKSIYELDGYDHYHDAMAGFLSACGHNYESGIYFDPEKYSTEIKNLLTLSEVGVCLYKYGREEQETERMEKDMAGSNN